MGLIQRIRKSDSFLTAKNKIVDYLEWHAFGTGILASSFYYMPFDFSTEFSYLLMSIVATTALGVQLYRVKENTDVSIDVGEAKSDSLRDQIGKEGHYALLGIAVPHLTNGFIQAVTHLIG